MKIVILIFLFLSSVLVNAQTTHVVAPKETLYSLGRQYNIHPKELAAYNNLSIESGLVIGQTIKIPPNGKSGPVKNIPAPVATTKQQTGASGNAVYHTVAKKETLYHISKLYKAVSVDDIKKWNHLSGDGLTEGAKIIVGYSNKSMSAPTGTAPEPHTAKPAPQAVISPVVVKEKPAEPEPEPSRVPEKAAASTVITAPRQPVNKTVVTNANGGFFKSMYDEQASKKSMVEQSGTAAIFKSTSGWEDGKYYCLHNTAPAGSIVRITNRSTQKSVYAKVLDVIPDLKQNNGILIRLSNAAANELGAGENNFEAVLNY